MGTATLNGQEVTFEDGPYLYDDPRFIYDEPCLFYDGGFSVLCLINLRGRVVGIPRKVGKRTSLTLPPIPKKEEECRTVLDVVISAAPTKVNDENVDISETVKRYRMDYGPIEVSVHKAKHQQREININLQAITSSIKIPKICLTNPNIKLLPIRTIVSSSKGRIKKPKLIFKTEAARKKNKK
jgi:hypothetical protein